MKSKKLFFVAACLLALASTGWAKDTMSVSVPPETATGAPIIRNNGAATGTIQLLYTVNAFQYPLGQFATFDVDWLIAQGAPATNYGSGIGFSLQQDQAGGHVDLAAAPATFTLTAAGQSGASTVIVSIENDKEGNPPPSEDGHDLVGNLKLDAGPKVGTVTSIQVHIRLVHPTACLKVYNFVTDQGPEWKTLTTTNLKIGTGRNNWGKVIASTPGQYSDNVLVANTCADDKSFSLNIGLDSSFETNPAGNPGNAVFTYSTAGEIDPATFDIESFGIGTPQGQTLCLQHVTVAAGNTFLATVHSQVKNNIDVGSLPGDSSSDSDTTPDFDFSASLHETTGANCTGALDTDATPNPAEFHLNYTLNQ